MAGRKSIDLTGFDDADLSPTQASTDANLAVEIDEPMPLDEAEYRAAEIAREGREADFLGAIWNWQPREADQPLDAWFRHNIVALDKALKGGVEAEVAAFHLASKLNVTDAAGQDLSADAFTQLCSDARAANEGTIQPNSDRKVAPSTHDTPDDAAPDVDPAPEVAISLDPAPLLLEAPQAQTFEDVEEPTQPDKPQVAGPLIEARRRKRPAHQSWIARALAALFPVDDDGLLTYAGDNGGLLIVAGAGSGKTTTLAIPTALNWGILGDHPDYEDELLGNGTSICMLDIKGELWAVTNECRRRITDAEGRQNTVVKFDTLDAGSDTVNVLSILDPDALTFPEDVANIAAWLVPEPQGNSNPFFTNAPRALVQWAICELFDETKVPVETDRTLRRVMEILSVPTEVVAAKKGGPAKPLEQVRRDAEEPQAPASLRQLLQDTVRRHKDLEKRGRPLPMDGLGYKRAAGLCATAADTLANVHTTLISADIAWLASRSLARLVSGPRPGEPGRVVDADFLTKGNVSAYICCTEKNIQNAPGFARVLIGSFMSSFARTRFKKPRCLFLLDEFPRLGRLAETKVALDMMRGYGVVIAAICQDMGQLEQNFGRDGVQGWVESVAIKMFMSINDIEAAKRVSDMIGKRTELRATDTHNGVEYRQDAVSLLSPADIQALPQGVAIVIARQGREQRPWWSPRRDITRNALVTLAHYKAIPQLAARAKENPYD